MATLEHVSYSKEDGRLIATEQYSDGSERQVEIKNGVTNYILMGGDK